MIAITSMTERSEQAFGCVRGPLSGSRRERPRSGLVLELFFFLLMLGVSPATGETCPAGPDADGDGVCDARDNCLAHSNPSQLDSDLDGFGNKCDADYNGNGFVSGEDFGAFLGSFGSREGDTRFVLHHDATNNGLIAGTDFVVFHQTIDGRLVPGPSGLACAGTAPCAAPGQPPSQAEHVLARISYGATAASRARIQSIGARAYIDEQLNPARIQDPELAARLAPMASLTLNVAELRAQYSNAADNARVPLDELTRARILRNLSSRKQLEEQLVDFWFNHFSVYGPDGSIRQTVVPYERESIRPYVFGRFSDLLRATTRAPAMLDYLDNRVNVAGGLNENYARELLELHTMGVDSGYSQADILEVARVLSGWGIDFSEDDGFLFRSNRHDDGAKSLLNGLEISANSGESGGVQLLDFLATHPATAERLTRKLVRRFVDETPPERLVREATQTFLSTDGDLRRVMETILTSAEFLDEPARRSTKVKRPAVLFASLARNLGADVDAVADIVETRMNLIGEGPYRARPPTGYPESSGFWASPGALLDGIAATEAAARGNNGFRNAYPLADRAAEAGSIFGLVDSLVEELWPEGISAATRNHALALAYELRRLSPERRRQQVLAFLLSSPEFLLH